MSIKSMYNEGKPVVIHDCDFDTPIDSILDNKMDNLKTESASTTNIVVTKYADPSTDMLDVEPSLELDQKGKIIQVELLPSSRLRNIQNKTHLGTLLNKSVIRKISKKKSDGCENKNNSDSDEKKFEVCTVCGKEMGKNHDLFCKSENDFGDNLNSSESCICSKCGKQFSSVFILKKHVSTCKMQSVSSPLCSKCGKHFSSNYNLKRHMTSCKLCPDDEKSPRYMCQCGRTYSQEWDMKKHKLKCKEGKKRCKHCLVASCNLLFYHKAQLIAHMKKDHNVKIQDPEILNFSSFEDFLSWKEREEEETYTYYSKQTGSNVSGVSVNTYYVCQHDGSDRTHTSNPRKTERRNKKGRMKTGRLCWSQMNVKQFKDGTVKVTYFPSHTHPLNIADTEHHPLPSSVTMEIQRQLSELKADPDSILSDESQDMKKHKKRQYGMTLRTLRALARKNRSLFRITAEAVEKNNADGTKIEMSDDKASIHCSTKHEVDDNFMQLLVTNDENVDDPEEMHCGEDSKQNIIPEKRIQTVKECTDQLNELKAIVESNKLELSMINHIMETCKTLVSKCKSMQEEVSILNSQKHSDLEDVMMFQPQSPLPSAEMYPLQSDDNPTGELNNDLKRLTQQGEKTVYQLIAVDGDVKPSNDYLYQNAVELVGAREFIIIAGNHAQYFQTVDSGVQYSLS